jgi:LysM repeat protein
MFPRLRTSELRVTLAARMCGVAAALLSLLAASGCGGGSGVGGAIDLDHVPTATLPATLPEPRLVSGGAVQPGGGKGYTIQAGDTLAAVAERFSISLEELLAANPGIDPASLHAGDVVRLPAGVEEAPPTNTPNVTATKAPPTATPTVRVVIEPTEAPPTEPAAEGTPTLPPGAQTYVVQAGDIPVTIAEKFGITVEELLAANPGIDPRGLQIGQVLIIPAPAGN